MRRLADPIRREQMLTLYRQGCNHNDVAKAMGCSYGMVKKELQLDPLWHDDVQDAMGVAFKPVLQHAVQLALKADDDGENEGSHKALALVMRFYEKNLDREHAETLLERKGEIAQQIEGNRPAPAPVIGSPEQIAALMAGVKEQARQEVLKDQAIDVEEVE